MNKKTVITTVGVGCAIVILWFLARPTPLPPNPALEALAQCLTNNGALMYGSYACSHCQAQKRLFESGAKNLPYVECTKETARCLAQNISAYPTWVFSDNTRLVGTQTLKTLAQKTNCPLPTDTQ